MNKILTVVTLSLAAMVGVWTLAPQLFENTVNYTQEVKEVVVDNTPEDVKDIMNCAECIQAAKDVARRLELEAELAQLESEVKERQTRIVEIEKELGTYWKDPSRVKALIRETFPEDPATAISIAYCESGLNPKALNPHNTDGTTDGGLWQINDVHNAKLHSLGLDKFDPEDATKFARMLYDARGGFYDWVCYTKGLIALKP